MDLLEAAAVPLISAAVDAVPKLFASSSTPNNPTTTEPVRDDRINLSSSVLPVAPTTAPSTTVALRTPGVNIPFQHIFFDITGQESKSTSVTVAALSSVRPLIKFFRDATLVSLEAFIVSSYPSLDKPVSVDLCWTPADVTLGDGVLKCPGAVRFTVGGLYINNQGVLPCDLKYMNPIIKSPVIYTNHPRLNAHFYKREDAKVSDKTAATVLIRGIIHCAHPTVYAS